MTEINIHPADELAAIREEIKQLETRAERLRDDLLKAPEAERIGRQYVATVIPSTRESIDKPAIIAALGIEVVQPFIRSTEVKTLKCVPRKV